jgi:hypothetical protein
MNKLFLVIIFCIQFSYSQEKKQQLKFHFESRVSAILPFNVGNNYLAKSNEASLGVNLSFNFIKMYNFKFGGGYDFIPYSITDVSTGGNINSSRYNSIFANLAYEIPIFKKVNLEPNIGIGSSKINLKSGNQRFGHQTGTDFRIGFNLDYELNDYFAFFMGTAYVKTKYDVNTSPEFVSFYDNSSLIQINIGMKFN